MSDTDIDDNTEELDQNNQLILLSGYSATGKSASLRNIRNQENWLYLNCESGKRLPFKNKFDGHRISDPLQVLDAFDYGIAEPALEGIILDSVTFLMEMFESQYVLGSANTMKAWGDYQQFFKKIMQDRVIRFNRPTIIIAHLKDVYDEKTQDMRTMVPVKGALANNGVESYFSSVLSAKRVPLKELKDCKSPLLNITEEDEALGFKYVFQTRISKTTTGERIRNPMGLFSKDELFIDNDAQAVLDRLTTYYKE